MARPQRFTQLLDADWLHREYVEEQRPAPQIAAELGCSKKIVYDALVRHGIPIRSRSRAARLVRSGRDFDDAAAVDLYAKGYSGNDIAVALNACKKTVYGALEKSGVQIRSKREAAIRRRDVTLRRMPRPSHMVGVLDKCAACGRDDALELHHLDADPSNDSGDNLIALCWEHHMLLELLVTKALNGMKRRGLLTAV